MSGSMTEILRGMDLRDKVVLPGGEVRLCATANRYARLNPWRVIPGQLFFLVTIGGKAREYHHVDHAAAAIEARRHLEDWELPR